MTVEHNIKTGIQSHIGRAISVSLARVYRRAAAEHDAVATMLSMDEASNYLLTRFLGCGRMVELPKLLLSTANLLYEDTRNIMVITRSLRASVISFSFFWNDAVEEVCRFIDTAKNVSGTGLQDLDFWDVFNKMSNLVSQPLIALDAVVAIALAERGFVLNCRPKRVNVPRGSYAAGETATSAKKLVSLSNAAGVWIFPFRS